MHKLFLAILVCCYASIAAGETPSATTPACECPTPELKPRDTWNLAIIPFLWIAGWRGDVGIAAGNTDLSVPVDVSFQDLAENLKFGAMGLLQFRYRRLSLYAGANYLSLGSTRSLSPLLNSDGSVKLQTVFGTANVAYDFEPWRGFYVSPYVGARWWWVETGLSLQGGRFDGRHTDSSRVWADPVFGVLLHKQITDDWMVEFSGDVGGGVSNVSWQVFSSVGYNLFDWSTLFIGYRFVGIDYEQDGLIVDIIIQGLVTGVRFTI